MRYIAAVIVSCILVCVQISAQEVKRAFTVAFPVGRSVLDRNFGTNGESMDSMVVYLEEILQKSSLHISEICFSGNVSPDGSSSVNRRVSAGRMASLERYLRSRVDIPDSVITRNGHFIEWDCLFEAVSVSSVPYREDVLHVLGGDFRGTDLERKYALMALDGGRVWRDMYRRFFPAMRNAAAVIVTCDAAGVSRSHESGPEPLPEMSLSMPLPHSVETSLFSVMPLAVPSVLSDDALQPSGGGESVLYRGENQSAP